MYKLVKIYFYSNSIKTTIKPLSSVTNFPSLDSSKKHHNLRSQSSLLRRLEISMISLLTKKFHWYILIESKVLQNLSHIPLLFKYFFCSPNLHCHNPLLLPVAWRILPFRTAFPYSFTRFSGTLPLSPAAHCKISWSPLSRDASPG